MPADPEAPFVSAWPWLTLRNAERTFWVIYLLFPILTGLLAYHWLPNESPMENRDIVVSSHTVCTNDDTRCDEAPDVWINKQTGVKHTRAEFHSHAKHERIRLLFADFSYGLIGCFFFAFARNYEVKGSFFEKFGKAILVNLGFVLFGFVMSTGW